MIHRSCYKILHIGYILYYTAVKKSFYQNTPLQRDVPSYMNLQLQTCNNPNVTRTSIFVTYMFVAFMLHYYFFLV